MNRTVNRLLLDLAIRRSILLEQYKKGTVIEAIKLLNLELEPKLLAQLQNEWPLRTLLAANNKLIAAEYARLRDTIVKRFNDLSKLESSWQIKALKSSTPIGWDFIGPASETLRTLVEKQPIYGATVSDWFANLGRNTAFRVNQQIRMGVVEGSSIADIVRSIKGTRAAHYADGILNTSRHELNTIVRTGVSEIVNATREATYSQNDDVIKSVQLVETLDPTTCEECMGRDGEVYEIGEGPRPPFHPNCRGSTVPVLKSWKELGIPAKELNESTRASMDGQVPESMKYADWLAEQSKSVQEEALGIQKAELFRSGKIDVKDFVDEAGRILTLKELASEM
jgi:SPP1 gp7 family putative phage head morphogenesis protein